MFSKANKARGISQPNDPFKDSFSCNVTTHLGVEERHSQSEVASERCIESIQGMEHKSQHHHRVSRTILFVLNMF